MIETEAGHQLQFIVGWLGDWCLTTKAEAGPQQRAEVSISPRISVNCPQSELLLIRRRREQHRERTIMRSNSTKPNSTDTYNNDDFASPYRDDPAASAHNQDPSDRDIATSTASRGRSPSKVHPLEVEDDETLPLDLALDEYDRDNSESETDEMKLRVEQTLYPKELGSTGSTGNWLEDWLFPPHLPRSCQLLRRENIAVPACYLLVGILQGLSSPLINVFPLDLGATEAQQTTVSAIRSLPSSFKLIFGFLSDNYPVLGLRRKPYMLLGWLLASLSVGMLLVLTNLDVPSRNTGCFVSSNWTNVTIGADSEVVVTADRVIPGDAPSIEFFSLTLLLFGMGFWFADVMGDSIVAEKAKLEPPSARGSIQSSCYSYRFFGLMLAAPLSTWLYSEYGPYMVVRLLAFLPLTILPLVWMLHEPLVEVRSTREQCGEIWNTVCSRAVWQPMGFVYLFNMMQVSNGAWREYLTTVLKFTSCQLNIILIVAYVLLYMGILSYKYWMINWSWRRVYMVTTILNGFFSSLQILLIRGITFGLSPFWFALGDDAFAEFISGIQFLPTTIMMVHLCPAGSEGASYAMFTTVNNSALSMASALSTALLGLWPVSRSDLETGYLDGMVNLTVLTTCVQVSAILFVGLLPRYKEDLLALKNTALSSVGGSIFLAITFGSIAYAVLVGVMNIVNPGWMGES